MNGWLRPVPNRIFGSTGTVLLRFQRFLSRSLSVLSLSIIFLSIGSGFPASEARAESPVSASVRVDEIRLEGNRVVDAEAISSQIDLAPGPLTRSEITAQVKDLYATGFFDQVNAKIVEESGRSVTRRRPSRSQSPRARYCRNARRHRRLRPRGRRGRHR